MKTMKDYFKIHIKLDPAYEVIFYSAVVILISSGVIFTTTFQRLTVMAVVSVITAFLLLYFKRRCFLFVSAEEIIWMYFIKTDKNRIALDSIEQIKFCSRKVAIKEEEKTDLLFYMSSKNQKQLYHYLAENHPKLAV